MCNSITNAEKVRKVLSANGGAYCIQYKCVGILFDTESRKFIDTNKVNTKPC